MTFGERLEGLLRARGMSKSELARRIDLVPSAITQWTRDAWPPTVPNLFRVAEALGLTPSQLLRGVRSSKVA